jgi:hypothetical protein
MGATTKTVKDGTGNSFTVREWDDGSALSAMPVLGDGAGSTLAKAEDAAATSGDAGIVVLGVRRDTAASSSGTDGDYSTFNFDATGKLWTIGSVTITAAASSVAKAEDAASADADVGIPSMAVRKATPGNTSGTDGDYEMLQMSGGYLWVHDNKGLANLAFSATFSTLTRPANTTAYTAADSISDNATAGSVTALSATVADVNDDPIFISEILVSSTDTGLAGKKIRAYLFNSDPTASSGVSGGDNAAYSQKKAGYIGSFMGWMETGFSDGSVGRLVPAFNETNNSQAGGFVVTKPTSGAKTLYIQYQAVEAFTPSANSTTIIGTARGWQGRAV